LRLKEANVIGILSIQARLTIFLLTFFSPYNKRWSVIAAGMVMSQNEARTVAQERDAEDFGDTDGRAVDGALVQRAILDDVAARVKDNDMQFFMVKGSELRAEMGVCVLGTLDLWTSLSLDTLATRNQFISQDQPVELWFSETET
jgi:hypothetical protein